MVMEIKMTDTEFMTAQEMLANQATLLAIIRKYVEPSVLSKISHEIGLAAHAKYVAR